MHTTEYANGRKNIATSAPAHLIDASSGEVLKKDLGREVAARCLQTLQRCAEVQVGTRHPPWRDMCNDEPAIARSSGVKDRLYTLAASPVSLLMSADNITPKLRPAPRHSTATLLDVSSTEPTMGPMKPPKANPPRTVIHLRT